jgi:hypothetical protein
MTNGKCVKSIITSTNEASFKSILKELGNRNISSHYSKPATLLKAVCHVQHFTELYFTAHSVVSTEYSCHGKCKYDHLFPVPIMYEFVPCSVIGPGLQHNTRIIRDESLETDGIVAAIAPQALT